MPRFEIAKSLDAVSANKAVRYIVYAFAIALFVGLVLLPPILGIILKWDTVQFMLARPQLVSQALAAIQNSFVVALLVGGLCLIVGVPMAWLIARGKSRWISILDTLSDIPFIVPTAVLGGSLLLFWTSPQGVSGLFQGPVISQAWLLILLLHFTFSLPVVVRVVVGALLDYKKEYENASRTLGASPLTASRTVTLPILRPSLIAAFILAFARSVSETGATFVIVQAFGGSFQNGSTFLQIMKNLYRTSDPNLFFGATVFAGFILIAVSVLIFILIRILGPRLKLPLRRIYPTFERRLSYSKAEKSRNTLTLLIFSVIVLIPSLFIALPALEAIPTPTLTQALSGTGIWADFWQGLTLSYALAAVVTVLNVLLGLPVAIAIARKKLNIFTGFLDVLVNIPLVVPSIALGASLGIFWIQTFPFIPEMLLLIFAHMAITYPYFVRAMSAAVERIPIDMEEASRTLGARSFAVFRTIILPLTKYSLLSGAILMFTRSISETGATVAVVTTLKTAPVVLVNWFDPKSGVTALQAGLGSGILILFSFIILLILRLVVKGKGRY